MNLLMKIFYRLRYPDGEWFDVVDKSGRVIGKAPRQVCHNGRSFYLHRVVHLLIVNSEGLMLLQKRAPDKDIQPGKWDTAVGGHINPGESVGDALMRETSEELGFKLNPGEAKFLYSYTMRSDREQELVNTFLVHRNEKHYCFSKDEISEINYWPIHKIKKNIGKGVFTPNFEDEFDRYLNLNKNESHKG